MTAQRMMGIHSSAARLLPKPMLANAAKMTRMLIRRKKRASTWVDLSSRDRFRNCAKTGNSGISSSAEIVAADRLVERVHHPRYGGNARPAGRCADAFRLEERAEDRQRQIRMAGFDRPVEPIGKLALARQRA